MLPLSVFDGRRRGRHREDEGAAAGRVVPRLTAPLLLVNGMFLDAEFGPVFCCSSSGLRASVVLTVGRAMSGW